MSLSRLTVIIPTFYPGRIIEKCLASLPSVSEIIIIDNGEDLELEKIIRLQKHKIKHYKVGDVGLSKSFNIALAKSKNENILITQPDVYFEKNSILNLMKAQNKYKNAGVISPLLFEKKKYSQYDHLDLSLSKSGNLKDIKKPKKINIIPSGDICVEAVNATAMLIKKSIIKKVNGWDENIYTYHEDIDLCIRLRRKKNKIIKIKKSIKKRYDRFKRTLLLLSNFGKSFETRKNLNKIKEVKKIPKISKYTNIIEISDYLAKKYPKKAI